MATTLYFVQSDTLPQIKLTLTDEVTGTAKDLRQANSLTYNKTVSLHAKPATGTGVSFTRPAIIDGNPLEGIAYISWAPGDLNRPAGNYSAEIEIYDPSTGSRETIYELITLVIREDIADILPTPPLASNIGAPNAAVGG